MKMQTKGLHNLGLAIFTFGVLLGLILNGLTVWGDIEANLFDVSIGADQSLKSLRCPLVISSSETGAVTASFTNTADRELTLIILARISESRLTVMREYRTTLPLSPGDTRTLQWEVTKEDAAYEHFILVRIHALRNTPIPSQSSACGVLVLDIGNLTGNQIVTLLLIGGLGSMLVGARLWWLANRPIFGRKQEAAYAMAGLAISVILGIIVSYFGNWLLGGLLFLFSLILVVVIATHQK
jgi:hypothetical protein